MVTTNAPGAGTPKTYTVANTSGWSANTFWMRDKNTLAWSVVTCLGWTNQPSLRLTNCTGVPATNAGPGVITTGARRRDSGTIGGFIKIDMQDTTGVWRDVTMEILNYGSAPWNLAGANCGDPTPNAIIRIQRLRDNGGTCHYAGTTNASDYWPQTLWDPREGLLRDIAPTDANGNVLRDVMIGGVMHYIALDVRNLTRWFQGVAPYGGGSGRRSTLRHSVFRSPEQP